MIPLLPPFCTCTTSPEQIQRLGLAMARTLSACPLITIKEDYIDMDLSPRILGPPKDRADFEIKMCSDNPERENSTYPTDELFYKGNLLPLQLPPRLDLVHKPFHEPLSNFSRDTPIEDDQFKEKHARKKHWPKRLKFFKQTHLSSKIKASTDYLKSLFTKTNNSSLEEENDQLGGGKVISITLKSTIDREKFLEEGTSHRKSFSGVIRRRLTGKSSQVSGLSMCSSSDLTRWLEEESSIQGAIAYCKKTQENLVPSRKSVSDLSTFTNSFAAPRLSVSVSVGCENQERGEISRG